MNKQNIILGAIAVLAIIGAASWLRAPSQVAVAPSLGNVSTNGTQANLPNPSNFDYLVARLGLGLGTNTTNVIEEAQRMSLVSGTSTPCVIQNPFNATSSVQAVTMNITLATSSSMFYVIGTSTTQYATTSSMLTTTGIGASKQATLSWNPGKNNAIIGPSNWIVIGAGGGSPTFTKRSGGTGIVTAGSCQAIFNSAV